MKVRPSSCPRLAELGSRWRAFVLLLDIGNIRAVTRLLPVAVGHMSLTPWLKLTNYLVIVLSGRDDKILSPLSRA